MTSTEAASRHAAREVRRPLGAVRTFLRNVIKYRVLLLMLLPMAAVFIINEYLPMFGVLIAFKQVDYRLGILGSPWIGLKNFEFLFATTDAWRITRNTLLYNLLFIFSGLVLSVSVALALNEVRTRFAAKFYQTAMILPNFLSMVIVGYVVFALLNTDYGFVNRFLSDVFRIEPIDWYADPKLWPFILPIVNAWKHVGMGSVIYLAAIIGIDDELYEAAIIDGANRWQQIRHITIPMITPVMVIITILSLGGIFRADFGLFYQVTLNSPMLFETTDVIDTYVYRALINLGDVGMSSAANFYQSVVGFFMIMGANWLVRKINKEQALF